MSAVVRPADAADHARIRELIRAAFADEPVVADIVEELRGSGRALHELVAHSDGRLSGQVMLSRCWIDDEERLVPALVLSPLAVDPEQQRRGLGRLLIEAALSAARSAGEPYVFLEGDPGYYGGSGFVPAARYGFERPTRRIPSPAFQVVVLDDQAVSGPVVYPDAFWLYDAAGLRGDTLKQVRQALGE